MKRPRHFLFWFWIAWIGVFAGVEAWAIFTCPDTCTLSASVWFLQRSWWPLTVILAVLFIWLIWHFVIDRRSRK